MSESKKPRADVARAQAGSVEGSPLNRRGFIKFVGVTGAATTLPAAADQAQAQTTAAHQETAEPQQKPAASSKKEGWLFLNSSEVGFVKAACEVLIPADDIGPGALEVGAPVYIDRQLAGAYGQGARLYLDGPFPEGATPQQGYQLPLKPAELLRIGIGEVNAYVKAQHGDIFQNLDQESRVKVLESLEKGEAILSAVPTGTFFDLLLQLVMEAYFADPIYGGNRDKVVWDMLGFPGAGVDFSDKIAAYRNKPYKAAAKGIADVS